MHISDSVETYYDEPMRSFPLLVRCLYHIVLAAIFIFSKLMWRWKVEHAEGLETGEEQGSVIICNHTSMAELLPLVSMVWRRGRRVRPIFKSEFNKVGIVCWTFSCIGGGIPVDRATADMKALRCASHALKRGEDVLIFPEGTRVRSDEQEVKVHGGFAVIASMAKAPIIPVAVCGFRDITPDGKHMMRPKKCWIRVGEAVRFDDAPEGLRRRERSEWVEHEAMQRVYDLRDALRREHPGRF